MVKNLSTKIVTSAVSRVLLLSLITVALSMLFIAFQSSTAQAAGLCPPQYGPLCTGSGDGGGHGTGGGSGTIGGGSDNGDDSDGGPPPVVVEGNVCDPTSGSSVPSTCFATYTHTSTLSFADTSANSSGSQWYDEARSRCSGDDVAGAVVEWSYRMNTYNQAILTGSSRIVSVDCVDFNITEVSRSCVVRSEAIIQQVIPTSRTITSASDSSGFLQSDRSREECDDASTSVFLSSTPASYGRYTATATSFRIPVTYERRADPILGTVEYEYLRHGAEYPTNPNSMRLQIDCSGVSTSWSGNPSWTHTDCGPEGGLVNTPIYQCVPADSSEPAVTVNDRSGASVTLRRDGEANEVNWRVIEPSSAMSVDNATTRWTRTSDGTPWRSEGNNLSISQANVKLSINPNSGQLFTSDTATAWRPGALDTAYVSGYWASEEGEPTRIRPSWNYTGTIRVETVRFTGFNGSNWTWTTTQTDVDSSAICHGAYANLTFARAVSGPSK